MLLMYPMKERKVVNLALESTKLYKKLLPMIGINQWVAEGFNFNTINPPYC